MPPFREAVRTAGGLGLPSARATFANSLERRSSLFGALEHVWHQEALILTTLTRQGRGVHSASTCVLTPLHCGVCPSMMYVRVCVCVGQTLLSYARGFPRGPKT